MSHVGVTSHPGMTVQSSIKYDRILSNDGRTILAVTVAHPAVAAF